MKTANICILFLAILALNSHAIELADGQIIAFGSPISGGAMLKDRKFRIDVKFPKGNDHWGFGFEVTKMQAVMEKREPRFLEVIIRFGNKKETFPLKFQFQVKFEHDNPGNENHGKWTVWKSKSDSVEITETENGKKFRIKLERSNFEVEQKGSSFIKLPKEEILRIAPVWTGDKAKLLGVIHQPKEGDFRNLSEISEKKWKKKKEKMIKKFHKTTYHLVFDECNFCFTP